MLIEWREVNFSRLLNITMQNVIKSY